MKILITGNMGYVGPYLTKHLKNSMTEYKLIGYDMGYFASCLTNSDILPESLLNCQIFGDVRNISSEIFNDIDAVIHLAAISNDPMGDKFESVTKDINYKSSVRIAKFAKDAGVECFVFASSCSIYGAANDYAKTENSPLNPLTAYARSKVGTEEELEALANSKFKVTSLRFATACGMSERLRLDLVLNDFVACAVTSKKITILSDGTPWRPLINVKDMALALEWGVNRKKDHGNFIAVNVGRNDWNFQVKDLADAVADVIGNVDIAINPKAAPDKRSYRVDFSLFEKIAPDNLPRYDLTSTIIELRDGLQAIQFNDPEFRESNFMRLKVLTSLQKKGYLSKDLNWQFNQSGVLKNNS